MFDLQKYRKDVEKFNGETNLEYYLNWSGQKDELDLSSIYSRYSHLFHEEDISRIRELRAAETKSKEEERRLRYLQSFATEELLAQHVKEYTDNSYTAAAKEVVNVDGKEIPYRMAEITYHNESDREKRGKIFRARNKVIEEKFNPILQERCQELHSLSMKLGYANYLELFRDAKNIDFSELDNTMMQFLRRTETLYVEKMDEKTDKTLGIRLTEAEKHDIAFMFRAKEFDSLFRKENAYSVLDRTLKGIGFNLSKHRNVSIDLEERPKKDPRAFTAIVKIPDDIRLVVMPKGGQDDYAALLHEAGHTVHHASVDPSLPIEYKWLGDTSVTETYAFLLEYLMLNKSWLSEIVGTRKTSSYLDFGYLYKLYFLRRYAAKLRYEILLHTSKDIKDMSRVYKDKLEGALKFKHPEAHYLVDLDDAFYSAQYLRAWIFEAQLRAKIVADFGNKWFVSADAGKFLSELWSNGQKYDVTELATQIGSKGLDISPIATEIEEHFKNK